MSESGKRKLCLVLFETGDLDSDEHRQLVRSPGIGSALRLHTAPIPHPDDAAIGGQRCDPPLHMALGEGGIKQVHAVRGDALEAERLQTTEILDLPGLPRFASSIIALMPAETAAAPVSCCIARI